ncbi:MAG: hypothetical protein ABI432_10515 [Flavobacteriales bacterium]
MIISRIMFRLKFGQAKPAIALWKEIMDHSKESKDARPMWLMTDMSGPNYTLVCDVHMRGFTDLGPVNHVWMTDPRIRELYPKFTQLCDSSVSQLYHVEHQVGGAIVPGNIMEQMTFRLKFGQARPACAIWRRVLDAGKESGYPMRLITDITGPSYTMIMDMSYKSMLEYGPHQHYWMTNEKMQEAFHEFLPLCDSSERTLYSVVHMV